jgi:hypothetical protein
MTTTCLTNIVLQTCNIMSGHRKGDKSYFVPHTQLPLAHSVKWYCVRRLLPYLQSWYQQSNIHRGDKSSCCTKFLNHILPYFIEVLVQDGIYFTQDFSAHPMSMLLKVRFLLCLNVYFLLASHRIQKNSKQFQATSGGLKLAEPGSFRGLLLGLLTRYVPSMQPVWLCLKL